MKKDNYISLIYKKLKGDISLEEQSLLDVWESQSTENEQTAKQLEQDWQLTKTYESNLDFDLDIEADFSRLQKRIQAEEQIIKSPIDNLRVAHQPIGKVVQMSNKKSTSRWIAWASAAVVALAVGFWFMSSKGEAPLDMLALETKFKEQKEVQLADGTKVRLNGDSKLSYPTNFIGDKRVVKLTGEAFFEVAKNERKPFIIETNKTNVTVLGTSFNVKAKVADSETEVVVKTGKVRLENKVGDKKVELIANQRGVYNSTNNKINQVKETDMNELAWFSGKLIFKNMPWKEVIEELEKQFEVNIQLKNERMKDCGVDGIYRMEVGVKSILEELAKDSEMIVKSAGNTNFELSGGVCE